MPEGLMLVALTAPKIQPTWVIRDRLQNQNVAIITGSDVLVLRIAQALNELVADGPMCEWAIGVAAYETNPRYVVEMAMPDILPKGAK